MDDSWSPETLHESSGPVKGPDEELERKIEHWKQELLDTGKRNKMINFRETRRSTLQILEPEMTVSGTQTVSTFLNAPFRSARTV